MAINWYHYASPATFYPLAGRLAPWFAAIAALLAAAGLWIGFGLAPTDATQGEAYRIIYIHVPTAWMAMFVYLVMAFWSALALAFNTRLSAMMAQALAPTGALMAALALWTGAFWGRPTWGTYWAWDARMTSTLILLFLYLGVMGLYAAIDDRRNAARAAGFLAIVGVALLPVIRWSVVWWNSLHQGQTIRLLGESSMDASMLAPLAWMIIGTKLWFLGSLLSRARADNLRREAGKDWVARLSGGTP